MPIRRIPPAPATPTEAPPSPDESAAPSSHSEKVGYKNPPRHTRFAPGQSGNPKGRPKAAKGLKTIVRDAMTQKVAVRTAAGEKKISRIEAVVHKTIEQAMKGNTRAFAELLKLYAAAVPEAVSQAPDTQAEGFSDTDLAILDELRAFLTGDEGEKS